MNDTGTNEPTSQSPFVTLISNDGFEFHVRRSAACKSVTIRRMLDPASPFMEARTGVVHFNDLSGIVLEKVVEYFYYAEKHRDSVGVPDMDFPAELCLELLMAADFLDT